MKNATVNCLLKHSLKLSPFLSPALFPPATTVCPRVPMWQAVPALAKARSTGTSFKKISWQEYTIFTIKYGKLWAVHPKSYGESSYTADFPRGLPLEVGKDMPVGYGHLGAHPSPHPWNTATLHTCSVHATLGLPVVGTCYEIVTCYCHGARFSPNSVKTALQ